MGWQVRRIDPAAAPLAPEAPRRPAPCQSTQGEVPLAQARGIGPASLELLGRLGVNTLAELRAADPIDLYARARAAQPRTSLNLLWALIGAVEDRDWREVARTERTSVLLALEQRGLLD